jgi:A/G-specific adenine glycosylase
VQRHGGELPRDEAMLRALPGIGPYTASALRAIVHGAPCVPVDGNVLRVMARLHRVETALPDAVGRLHDLAGHLASDLRPGEVAQALMDLGATVCRPRRPACLVCPWRPACQAHRTGLAEQLPRRTPRRERLVRRGLAFLLARPDGAILFRRRPSRGLLGGLHELPSSPWQEGPLDVERALAHAPSASAWRVHPTMTRHGFTHFVLELTLAEARVGHARPADDASGEIWCRPAELDRLALPAVMKKLLRMARIAAPDPARAHSEGDSPAHY